MHPRLLNENEGDGVGFLSPCVRWTFPNKASSPYWPPSSLVAGAHLLFPRLCLLPVRIRASGWRKAYHWRKHQFLRVDGRVPAPDVPYAAESMGTVWTLWRLGKAGMLLNHRITGITVGVPCLPPWRSLWLCIQWAQPSPRREAKSGRRGGARYEQCRRRLRPRRSSTIIRTSHPLTSDVSTNSAMWSIAC